MLHAINEKIGGESVPRLKVRDLLNDVALAMQADRDDLDGDDTSDRSLNLCAMDTD